MARITALNLKEVSANRLGRSPQARVKNQNFVKLSLGERDRIFILFDTRRGTFHILAHKNVQNKYPLLKRLSASSTSKSTQIAKVLKNKDMRCYHKGTTVRSFGEKAASIELVNNVLDLRSS